MRFLSQVASHGWTDEMRAELAVACLYAKAVLESEEPRTINFHEDHSPVLVFTDSAWEPDSPNPAGAGVVILDALSGTRAVHEINVPGSLIERWRGLGKTLNWNFFLFWFSLRPIQFFAIVEEFSFLWTIMESETLWPKLPQSLLLCLCFCRNSTECGPKFNAYVGCRGFLRNPMLVTTRAANYLRKQRRSSEGTACHRWSHRILYAT